ncbi:MAG: PrgI family protein [Candidatus Pacebacteria bacterium]|nr:PrgI family protein [Candidatus Paceibacterota bacterium]
MRFEVPQFISLEDKLFGPFTFMQSLYLVGGGGILFAIHKMLPSFVTVLVGIPIAAFSLALVFYKPNGRPFMTMVEAFILYSFTQKFYLWRRRDQKLGAADVVQVHEKFPEEGALPKEDSRRRISDLAWSLDILDFDN